MSNTDNNPKSVIFWLIGTVIVAAISAWGASNASYNNGVAAVEREISATQTAEIRLLTLTPKPTSPPETTPTPNIIEVTRIVTVEVTRIAEVTRVVNPFPVTTPNPGSFPIDTTRDSNVSGFSITLKSIDLLQNGDMKWNFDFKNDSTRDSFIGFNYLETYAVDENGFQYKVVDADSGAIDKSNWGYTVKRGVKVSHWFEFSGPKDGAKSFTMYIAAGCIQCPSYPSFKFNLP